MTDILVLKPEHLRELFEKLIEYNIRTPSRIILSEDTFKDLPIIDQQNIRSNINLIFTKKAKTIFTKKL